MVQNLAPILFGNVNVCFIHQFPNIPPSTGRNDPWIMEALSLRRNMTGLTTSAISGNTNCIHFLFDKNMFIVIL